MKTNHDVAGVLTSRTWYAYDASGGLAATYEQEAAGVSAVQTEVPIGGGSRIGVLYRQVSNTAIYELSDHLGNVRATFRRDATLEEWTDYDAWGTPLEGRRQVSTLAYRYAYQGQEREQVGAVSSTAFELRAWDARIGRWTAPDPYGQYFSAYVGMGNNPVSMVDPDGGWAGPGGKPWRFLRKLREFGRFDMEKGVYTVWKFGKVVRKAGAVARVAGATTSGLSNMSSASGNLDVEPAYGFTQTPVTGKQYFANDRITDKGLSYGLGEMFKDVNDALELPSIPVAGFTQNLTDIINNRSEYGRLSSTTTVKFFGFNVNNLNTKPLLKVLSVAKKFGIAGAFIGGASSLAKYRAGEIGGPRLAADWIAGGVGLLPGAGWVASGSYSLIMNRYDNYMKKGCILCW